MDDHTDDQNYFTENRSNCPCLPIIFTRRCAILVSDNDDKILVSIAECPTATTLLGIDACPMSEPANVKKLRIVQ